jgi:PAS domain S-box-containing protein
MLSSAQKSVPTTKQFRQPYFMDIAPDGAILSTCARFATLVNKQNLPDLLGINFLHVFSHLGKIAPAITPDLFGSVPCGTIDLFIQEPDIKPFVIRWIAAPRYEAEVNAVGWQLTGTKVYSDIFPLPEPPELPEAPKQSELPEPPGTLSDIVISADPEGNIIYWNKKAERFFGIPGAAIGQPWRDLVHLGYVNTTEQAAQKILLETGFWEGETTYVSRDGKKSYLISAIHHIRDKDRRISGIMVLSKDITEIRLEEQQIPGILENITDGFFVLDTHCRVKLWNREAERITCLSAAEMIGQPICEAIPEWNDTNIGRSFYQAFKNKMTVTVEQYYERSASWLEVILYPSEQGIFAYFRDVTLRKKQDALLALEKKLLQQEVDKQKGMAQAMMDAQEKVRAEIGKELHDNINQILSTTKLYLELAQSDHKDRLSLIDRCAGNIHNAIREIRNLSRTLVPSSIGDLGLTDSLIDLVETVQRTGTIRIEFCPTGSFDERLNDKTKLMLFRIIQEQLNNVLKHSDASKLIIELTLVEPENRIELRMTDDGKGFNPETVRKKGLGLSNIRSRADLLGGKVTIRSAPGRGCQLRVQVPVAQQ